MENKQEEVLSIFYSRLTWGPRPPLPSVAWDRQALPVTQREEGIRESPFKYFLHFLFFSQFIVLYWDYKDYPNLEKGD
jgi:hypothetical protein